MQYIKFLLKIKLMLIYKKLYLSLYKSNINKILIWCWQMMFKLKVRYIRFLNKKMKNKVSFFLINKAGFITRLLQKIRKI